jgi:predicted ATPase
MARLKVQNVGPIGSGYESHDGFIEFKGVTLFIGNQGSGKSTIAKIYATLSWIEKALVRGDFTTEYVIKYNRFKKHLAYQNLSNYINDESYIEYIGHAYQLIYDKGQFVINKKDDTYYSFPKIMYVPAERNFISSVDRPELVKRLPLPLYTFMDVYEDAKQNIGQGLELPISNVIIKYNKHSKRAILKGDRYEIDLLEASSGFQSFVPLFIVTQHLSEIVKSKDNVTRKNINLEEEERIRKMVSKLLAEESISDDVFKAVLEKISSKFRYESFINIVEEPEQNLFPRTQRSALFNLIKYKNQGVQNKLVITTHSPYIINFLTLAVKAFYISKLNLNDQLKKEIEKIVPEGSMISGDEINMFQLDENTGSIVKLQHYEGLPSDENLLNDLLEEFNNEFVQLLKIENDAN